MTNWKEELRDLYLHKSPDEEGFLSKSITFNWATFTIKQKQDKIAFYLTAQESIEDFISSLLSQKKAQLLEAVRGRKIALSDKVRAIGSYQLALKEVKKHEWSYNKALADVEALIEKIL